LLGGKGGEGDEQGGEGAGDGNRTAPFPSVKSFSADMVAMDPYISTLFFLTVEDELPFLAPFPAPLLAAGGPPGRPGPPGPDMIQVDPEIF
jgi:hypothetical protein